MLRNHTVFMGTFHDTADSPVTILTHITQKLHVKIHKAKKIKVRMGWQDVQWHKHLNRLPQWYRWFSARLQYPQCVNNRYYSFSKNKPSISHRYIICNEILSLYVDRVSYCHSKSNYRIVAYTGRIKYSCHHIKLSYSLICSVCHCTAVLTPTWISVGRLTNKY